MNTADKSSFHLGGEDATIPTDTVTIPGTWGQLAMDYLLDVYHQHAQAAATSIPDIPARSDSDAGGTAPTEPGPDL